MPKINLNPVSISMRNHMRTSVSGSYSRSENITFHDLYEQYPNFDIDVKFRTSLNKHDIIITS
jgi:glutathione-regulated potassium-efflux system ancillary protein KefG